jgi:RNA polymerase sigma factor (sigma-70 family)
MPQRLDHHPSLGETVPIRLVSLSIRNTHDRHAAVRDAYGLHDPVPHDPESLFREHYSHLFRALAVASGDSEMAADAVQGAFIRLCLHWTRIAKRGDPVQWLRRAAVDNLGNGHGSVDRRPAPAPAKATNPSPEPPADFRGDMKAALARLSLPERLAIVLHYMEDLAPRGIADAMHISEKDADTYLHCARDKLQPNLMPGPWAETIFY